MRSRALIGAGLLCTAGLSAIAHFGRFHNTGFTGVLTHGIAPLLILGLLLCWWLLRAASSRTLIWAAVAWAVPLLLAPPLLSWDLYAYAGQADLVVHGINPYTHGPADYPSTLTARVDRVWAHTTSPYGPVFLRLAAGVVTLTGERPQFAVVLLRLLSVLGVALLAWGVLRLSGPQRRAPAVWLAVANPLVLLHGVAGGHNDVLMAGLMILGLSLASVSLPAAAALIVLAGLVKAPALLALAFLPLIAGGWRRHTLGVTALCAGVTAVVVTYASGLGWGWTTTLTAGEYRRSLMSLTTGVGELVGGDQVPHQVGLALIGLAVLALLATARPGTALRHLGLALLVAAVLAPVVQPWYLFWSLAPLAVTLGTRARVALAASSSVLCVLLQLGGSQVIRPPFYGLPVLLALAAAGLAAIRRTPAADRSAA